MRSQAVSTLAVALLATSGLGLAACDAHLIGGFEDGAGGGGGEDASGQTTSATTAPTTTSSTTGAGSGGSSSASGSSSSSSSGSPTGGGPDVCNEDPPHQPAGPPERPAGATPGDGGGVFLGVSRWFLGETDRNGTVSPAAWQGYGYDVDRVNTVDGSDAGGEFDSSDLVCSCTPVGGEVNAGNLEDGPNGLDNSFGKNVLSFLGSVLENPSETATEGVEAGRSTVAFDLSTLGSGSDYDPVAGGYFKLRNREAGTWQFAPESLVDGDPTMPLTTFTSSYVSSNIWVSAPLATVDIPVEVGLLPLPLLIRDAVVTMELSADHLSATGMISGRIDTEEFVDTFGEIAAASAGGEIEGLCPGDQLLDSIVQNIRAASDVGQVGPCTSITIGIGFEAEVVDVEGVAPPLDPIDSPCDG